MDPSRDHLNRKLGTITELALYRRTLRLVCSNQACGNDRLLDCVPLWWMFSRKGWDDRLGHALARFYCSKCWKAHRRVLRPHRIVTEDSPAGLQYAYGVRKAWRQMRREGFAVARCTVA